MRLGVGRGDNWGEQGKGRAEDTASEKKLEGAGGATLRGALAGVGGYADSEPAPRGGQGGDGELNARGERYPCIHHHSDPLCTCPDESPPAFDSNPSLHRHPYSSCL